MISVVIANYNGVHFLRDCLDSLKAQTYRDIEIIVVDNGSSDNSVEFLHKNYPEVKVIQNKEKRHSLLFDHDISDRIHTWYAPFPLLQDKGN